MLVIIITVVKVINRDGAASDKVMETVHYKGFNHP